MSEKRDRRLRRLERERELDDTAAMPSREGAELLDDLAERKARGEDISEDISRLQPRLRQRR